MSEEGGREKEGGTERGMVRLLQGVWGGLIKGAHDAKFPTQLFL